MNLRRGIEVLSLHWRTIAVPLACLVIAGAAWLATITPSDPFLGDVAPRVQIVAHIAAGTGITAITVWLAVRCRRAFAQGRQDEEAAELLDIMRLEAMQPMTVLLEVHDVQWTAQSGQRIWAVDVLTGEVSDRWIPGQANPPGSFVLLRHRGSRPSEVIARMAPGAVEAANRHGSADCDRGTPGADTVVEAAERMLRER